MLQLQTSSKATLEPSAQMKVSEKSSTKPAALHSCLHWCMHPGHSYLRAYDLFSRGPEMKQAVFAAAFFKTASVNTKICRPRFDGSPGPACKC